ncbi:MAG: heme-binding protein [Bdellovibrionaceae bacterium]|nr:heme-binding protein [Pseudobdellovibrionaceae bacterium]
MDRTPEPEYIVILNEEIDNNIFEIRDYKQLTIAETIVENTDFDKMSGIAFKRLGGYIFGDNQKEEEIQMTAPVLLDRKPETWKMIFVLPKKYSIENAPAPKNQNVVIKTMKEKRFAVIQFSGSLEEKKFDEHLEKLREWIKSKNYEILSDPLFAGYNHPWTIPFLRRNEVLIEVSK